MSDPAMVGHSPRAWPFRTVGAPEVPAPTRLEHASDMQVRTVGHGHGLASRVKTVYAGRRSATDSRRVRISSVLSPRSSRRGSADSESSPKTRSKSGVALYRTAPPG